MTPDTGENRSDAQAASLAARRAMAEALGVALDSVELVSLEPVVWPDSALGCPQPDQMYLQVLTPGYRVTVALGDENATYHTDRNVPPAVVRCDAPGEPAESLPDR